MTMTLDDYLRRSETWLGYISNREGWIHDCKYGYYARGDWVSVVDCVSFGDNRPDGFFPMVLELAADRLNHDVRKSLRALYESLRVEIEAISDRHRRTRAWPVDRFDAPAWTRICEQASRTLELIERDGWFHQGTGYRKGQRRGKR